MDGLLVGRDVALAPTLVMSTRGWISSSARNAFARSAAGSVEAADGAVVAGAVRGRCAAQPTTVSATIAAGQIRAKFNRRVACIQRTS
jgi:hypothetical protein